MSTGVEIAIRVVGEVQVVHQGRVVRPRLVGGPRCGEVLAYLAVNKHRDVPQEELARILWPVNRPRSWYSALRGVLSRVRDTLEMASLPSGSIKSRGGSVRLTLPAGLVTDLELVRQHSRAVDEGAEPAAAARAVLQLLDGPLVLDATGSWADDVRAECAQLRRRALEADAIGSLDRGEFDRAVASAEALLATDPLQENAYRILMRGYSALDDRVQALNAAARCRQLLAEELGVRPSSETEALYLEILARESSDAPAPVSFVERRSEPRTPVVGRLAELRAIADAVDRADRGAGQFVVLSGEAGTGKTTLALAAMDEARDAGADVLFGRCSEEAIISFEPFAEAVSREFDTRGPRAGQDWLRDNGSDILRIVPHVARRFGEPVPSSSDVDDRAVIMTAVLEWLTSPTRTAPTVLVIDDLHWASAATLAVIRYVIHASDKNRLCVIATVRDEYIDQPDIRKTLLAPTRSSGVHRLRLGGFSLAEVGALVDAAQAVVDPIVLYERTQGLPLFVVSLINSHQFGDRALPESVAESVAQRERLLGADALRLLRLCSVIGMTSPRDVLRAVMADVDDIGFADAVDELVRHRLIGESGVDGSALRLRHPVVQEAVYAGISGRGRTELHSRVAVVLEEVGTLSDPTEFTRLAYHFSRGLDRDRPLAAAYAWRAGDSAVVIGAYEDAVVYYTSAADRLVPRGDSAQRCRLLVDLGRAQRKARDPGFRTTLLGAVDMARTLGDVDLQVAATLANDLQGILYIHIYSDTERIESLYEALHALDSSGRGDNGATARLLGQLAIELIWTSDFQTRRDLLARADIAARSTADRGALIAVLSSVLVALRSPECKGVRRAAYDELMVLLAGPAARAMDPLMAVWVARTQVEYGELLAAQRTIGRVTAAQASRDPEMAWLARNIHYSIDFAAGRLEQCEAQLDELRNIPASPIETYSFGRVLAPVAALRTLRGDMSEVVAAADAMTARFDLVDAYRPCLAAAFVDVGDLESASELIGWYDRHRVHAIARDHAWLTTVATLGRVAAQMGDVAICAIVYDLLIEHADVTAVSWAVVYGVVHHHLAHISITLGEFDRAAMHLDDAIREHSRRGFVGWQAESAYLVALLDSERTGRVSEELFTRARRAAEGIGATAVLRRIDNLRSLAVV